jgi:hypothetical protein
LAAAELTTACTHAGACLGSKERGGGAACVGLRVVVAPELAGSESSFCA